MPEKPDELNVKSRSGPWIAACAAWSRAAPPALGSIITTSNVADWNSGGGGGGLAYGHGIAGLAGVQTLGWTFPAGGAVGNVAAAFPTGVNPDLDGDGLLDVWEITYFGNLNQTPAGDFDGDYSTNIVEITAGISPTNAAL